MNNIKSYIFKILLFIFYVNLFIFHIFQKSYSEKFHLNSKNTEISHFGSLDQNGVWNEINDYDIQEQRWIQSCTI